MLDNITISRDDATLASAIFESFCRIERRVSLAQRELGMPTFVESVETTCDRWLTAAFLFSVEIAKELDTLINWDNYSGVFTYEHLEAHGHLPTALCNSLPSALWNNTSCEAWYDMADNCRPSDKDWLRAAIKAWALANEVPLAEARPDSELSADGLSEKYLDQHPYYGRQAWKNEVQLGDTLKGYWDWVHHCIQTEA